MGGLLKQYLWIANLIVILFCSYFAAKIINVYVGKALEVHKSIGVLKSTGKLDPVRDKKTRSDFKIIIDRNIFDSSEAPPVDLAQTDTKKEVKYVPGKDAVKTSLPVKVFAVLVIGEGKDKRSSATVGMGKRDVDVYAVKGDKTFSPGVTLVQIKPDRIEFVNKGRLEYAELYEEGVTSIFGPPSDKTGKVASKEVKKGPESVVKQEEGKFLIDQREIDNALTNLDKLYTEIRAVPNFKDGRVNGLKVLSVKPGSVFSKLGLKRGDVLSRINGIELDVKRGFDIFNNLKDQKSFNLDLVRGGLHRLLNMKLDNRIIIFVMVFALLGLSSIAFGQSRGLPSAGGASSTTKTIPSGMPSATPTTAEGAGKEQTIVKTDLEGPLQEEEKVYLNVHDADIKDVIKQISKATAKNFIIDDKIRGKVTIISERPMTREEAYQTFLSALEVAGYTTVKGPANVIKIVSLKDASKSPIPTHVDTTPYTDSFITRLIPLENISALDMSNAIKDLVSRSGNLFAYPATNTLIITDSGANIDRIMKIVKELDQEGPQQVMEIIPIRNTGATQIAKMIQDLFEQQKKTTRTRTTRRSKSAQLEELQEVSKIIADERTNSIIVMASKRAIEKVRAIIRKLDSRLRPEDEGRIHVYYLKHAKAKELSEVLSSLTASSGAAASKKGAAKASVAVARFEGGVKITADEATNALIITALPKDFRTLIDKVVSKLDIPRRQVYFESVIMELSINKGSEYGTSGMGGAALAGSLLGFGQTLGAPSMLGSIVSNSATQGTAAWPALLGGLISSRTTDIPIVGADGTASSITVPAFSAFISALATRGEANVVSTPNLLTLDNEEATMDVLSKEPIPGSTTFGAQGIASAQAVDYKEAGLEMKIKPQITEGDMIRLEIEQKLSGFSTPRFSSNLNAPAMKERKVKTTVVTENGQTVVLAGLMDDTASKTKRKVPILGDIPIIGFLFSMTTNSMSKSNLLIFITPHIIKDRTDFSAILKRKIDERNKFIDSNFSKSKRKKIRKTIKTHREDLLEFTEPVPLDREISMKGKVITVDPEIKKKSEPTPVITVPQSSVTTRGPSVPTTPAIESSKWKPVEPKYSKPVIVKPSYSAPVPVAPKPVRITPAPKSAIKAPTQPVYSQPQVVTPKSYTPAPKKTWKKKKKKVVEEAAPVITESTIEEKSISDSAIKKPAQWLPEQPKTTKTMEKVAPEVVKEVAPPPAPRVFNKPVIPESDLGATKQPSQEVVPPQIPKEEDRTPKAYIIKVPKKPKVDSGERFQKPDAGGIGTDLDLAY